MRQSSKLQRLLFSGVSVIVFAFPFLIASAATATNPLIPCGPGQCTFCDLFKLIQNVYDFIVFTLAPPVAILSVAVAGFIWFTSAGSEAKAKKARDILMTVALGLVIMYTSWIVINFIITFIAQPIKLPAASVNVYDPTTWFKLQCQA